jgi:ATP-dependent Zn protease
MELWLLSLQVEPPDRQGREEILNVHVLKKQLPLATDVDINVIAAATAGFTGYFLVAAFSIPYL